MMKITSSHQKCKIFPLYILAFFLIPIFVNAQTLGDVINTLQNIIDRLIPVVFALALLVFLWGIVRYIFSAGDEKAKELGKNIMIGGVLALFVAASIWGIVILLQRTLGIEEESKRDLRPPQF